MKHPIRIIHVLIFISFVCNLSAFPHGAIKDTTIACRLSDYIRERPIEKLYLHQDRTFYAAGETIWFKLYQILSASASHVSGVAYVDIVDGKGEVVVQAKYLLSEGQASGNLDIPADLSTGCYQIRAYTQWMLNEGVDSFFRREIRIKGLTGNGGVQVAMDSVACLRFFPEGGNLIEGLASKVALEAVNSFGKGLSVKGTILDTNKEVVQHFQTNADGRGSFFFQPKPGERYIAKVEESIVPFHFPEALPAGFVVNVKRFKEAIRITLMHNNMEIGKEPHRYSLVFHQGGQVLAQLPVDASQTRSLLDVPLDKLPKGVFTVTLVDENYQVYSERLLFTRFPESLDIHLTSGTTKKDGQEWMTVNVETRDVSGNPCPARLSLAVVAASMEDSFARTNFKTYLFLESELKGKIMDHLSEYWKPEIPESLSDIELLLLTHGWCRYSLNSLQKELKEPVYSMEQGLSIGGKVENKTRKMSAISVQAVLRQDSTQQFFTCPLDKKGRFELTDFSFVGTKEVIFSATDNRQQSFPIVMDSPRPLPPAAYIASPYNMPDSYQPFSLEKGTIRLDEVKVTSRKRDKFEQRRLYSENFVKTTFDVREKGYGDMRRLLQQVPGLVLISNADQRKANLPYIHISGTPKGENVAFVLDGFPVRDPEMVYSMDVSRVERIEVLRQTATMFGGFRSKGGIVAIYTKDIGGAKPSDKQICKWIGFNQTKEFYLPVSSDTKFFENKQPRHTLYWNPDVTTDSSGKAQVSFYLKSSEMETAPAIHCEGYSQGGLIGAGFSR